MEEVSVTPGGLETFSLIDGTGYGISVRKTEATAVRVDFNDLTSQNSYTLDFEGYYSSPQPVTGYIISLGTNTKHIQIFDPSKVTGNCMVESYTETEAGVGRAVAAPFEFHPCYLTGTHLGEFQKYSVNGFGKTGFATRN